MSHGKQVCSKCGTIVRQCRCPWNDATHTVTYVLCEACYVTPAGSVTTDLHPDIANLPAKYVAAEGDKK